MPDELSDFKIKELLKKESYRIRKNLKKKLNCSFQPKEYVNGESFSYLGRNYRLKLIQSKNIDIKLKGGYLEIYCPKNFNDKN